MVKLSTFVFVALSSLVAAQKTTGGPFDVWKDTCNKPENKEFCQKWYDWMKGGQSSRAQDQQLSTTRPKQSPKPIITPQSQPAWQPPPSEQSQPAPWQLQPWPSSASKNLPPPTPAPQQGSVPAFQQAICTVEIYSFTTRPEGQRTRTRTRTIIAPYVSTITSLLTTETTSIAVETIVQEQREQTITSSQTICN